MTEKSISEKLSDIEIARLEENEQDIKSVAKFLEKKGKGNV